SFENANVSLERDMLPMLVEKGRVTARTYDRFFIDIGVPDQYAAAQDQFPRRRGAVFFDRDGVLNHDGGYTHRVEDLRWIDGAKEAIKAVNDAGLFAFVVTNQAGVARGYYSEDDIKVFHDAMQRELRDFGAHIDAFEYCPHHPDGTVSNYQKTCERRKPGSGMLFDLMAEWPVEPAGSIMIGDRKSDLEAAEGAGIRGARFSGGSLSDLISDLNIGMPVSIPDASASLEEK
ncbi:MAG: HAD-IIIA family hydrolase, partial [Pseudomonadota bacterium]